jgi:hypothetical protein
MSSEHSKQLRVGELICFNDNPADRGKVTAIQMRYVTIKWDDGHQSLSGHNAMKRFELVTEA